MKKLILILLFLTACSKSPESSIEQAEVQSIQSNSGIVLTGTTDYETVGSDVTITLSVKSATSALRTEALSLAAGDQGFSLLTASCANFSNSRTCSVRLKFTVGTKTNATYTDNLVIADLSAPLNVTVNKPVPAAPGESLKISFGTTENLETLDFGTVTLSSSINKVIYIKDTTQKATAAIDLSVDTIPSFTFSPTSCSKINLNSVAGCSVRVIFSGSGKTAGPYTANLSVGSKTVVLTGVVQAAPVPAGAPAIKLSKDDVIITENNFGDIDLNQKTSFILKVKNEGTGTLTGASVSITGSSAFTASGSTCSSALAVGASCQMTVNFSGLNILGPQASILKYGGQSLSLSGNVLGSCPVGKHLEGFNCVNNIETQNITNGSKVRSYDIATSVWGPWKFTCSPNFELNASLGTCNAIVTTPSAPIVTLSLSNDKNTLNFTSTCRSDLFGVFLDMYYAPEVLPSNPQYPVFINQNFLHEDLGFRPEAICIPTGMNNQGLITLAVPVTDSMRDRMVFAHGVIKGSIMWDNNANSPQSEQVSVFVGCPDNTHIEAGICTSNIQNENIDNGTRTRNYNLSSNEWNPWSYSCSEGYVEDAGMCKLSACEMGMHFEGEICVNDSRVCTPEELSAIDANALSGQATWDSAQSTYVCQIEACATQYHVNANVCENNTRSCETPIGAVLAQEIYMDGAWGSCLPTSCNEEYHLTENSQSCESNIRSCSPPSGAIAAQETYSDGVWGSCLITECDTNSHIENNVCESNTRACANLPQGATAGSENYENGAWGSCIATACSGANVLSNGICTPKFELTDLNAAAQGVCTVGGADITYNNGTKSECEVTQNLTWLGSTPACPSTTNATTCSAVAGCGLPPRGGSCGFRGTLNTCWYKSTNSPINVVQSQCYNRVGIWNSSPNTLLGQPDYTFKSSTGDVYFKGTQGNNFILYKTSGSLASTKALLSVDSANYRDFNVMAEFKGKIYFAAKNGITGQAVWETDGSVVGTRPVVNLCPTTNCTENPMLFATSSHLYVFAVNSSGGYAGIYSATDPSSSTGYTLVPGSLSNFIPDIPQYSVVTKDILYFAGSRVSPASGKELLKVQNGEISLVKDIIAGSDYSMGDGTILKVLDFENNLILAPARGSSPGTKIYVSNGTDAGTYQVASATSSGNVSGLFLSGGSSNSSSVLTENYLYIQMYNETYGVEIFRIPKIAPHAPELVKDVYPGISGINGSMVGRVGDYVLFQGNSPGNGFELWYTNINNLSDTGMFNSSNGGLTPGSDSSTITTFHYMTQPLIPLYNISIGNKAYIILNYNQLLSISDNLTVTPIVLPSEAVLNSSPLPFLIPVGPVGQEKLLIRHNSPTMGVEFFFYKD